MLTLTFENVGLEEEEGSTDGSLVGLDDGSLLGLVVGSLLGLDE